MLNVYGYIIKMIQKSPFRIVRERYKQAQAEKFKESEKEQKRS